VNVAAAVLPVPVVPAVDDPAGRAADEARALAVRQVADLRTAVELLGSIRPMAATASVRTTQPVAAGAATGRR
jgi:hypothetical protein